MNISSKLQLICLIIGFFIFIIFSVHYYPSCVYPNHHSFYCLIFLSSSSTTTNYDDHVSRSFSSNYNSPKPPLDIFLANHTKLINHKDSTVNGRRSPTWQPSSSGRYHNPPPVPVPVPVSDVMEKGDSDRVVSIDTMNKILLQSYSSVPNSVREGMPLSASDQELVEARLEIEKGAVFGSGGTSHYEGLYPPIYWNISRFIRSYELMEKTLKVYIYKEGKKPIFHNPNLKGIYASEGWFMKQIMELSSSANNYNNKYLTKNPTKAHLFYFPFSSQMLEQTLYVPNSHSFDRLKQYLANYLFLIKTKYPFWNRTSGSDHFLVACHDWAPEETRKLMGNCIRALCNADIKEGFKLGKDVSLPETLMPPAKESQFPIKGRRRQHNNYNKNPAPTSSERTFLAFFAGKMHGYLRPILLQNWGNNSLKDPEMKIFGRMHKSNYVNHMKNSKYCICARGYEVNSPRLVESIMYGCVPVIISDNFVPPFLEVINWEKIAVFLPEKDMPELKNVLMSISERRYRIMQHRVMMVRRHFVWHPGMPEKYDIFHMILHSVWYNRVFNIN